MVAGTGKEGQNPPYYYARACRESALKGGLVSNTSDLINNKDHSLGNGLLSVVVIEGASRREAPILSVVLFLPT